MTAHGSTTRRGYGHRHQQARARVARVVAAGAARCARCGEWIQPGAPWHLDHDDHPDAHRLGLYLGASHAVCNNRAAHSRREHEHTEAKALAFFDTSA